MTLLKFCLLVLVSFIQHIPQALVSLVYLITDKRRFIISWVTIDYAIANDLYGVHRTLSSIIGEHAYYKVKYAATISKFIDSLAVIFGDKENHCYREWQDYLRNFK